mmetsp:Transcript_17097/g.58970  ORF Transcript_17097/g.58970 Transcript_17097/m.58970 type:complete len:89 (+) Transcript_17097:247-513(+)
MGWRGARHVNVHTPRGRRHNNKSIDAAARKGPRVQIVDERTLLRVRRGVHRRPGLNLGCIAHHRPRGASDGAASAAIEQSIAGCLRRH